MKFSVEEVVLSEDLVHSFRERANKHDGIIYDFELEYDMKAAATFLVERGELIEHGKGEGGLLHFYTFADAEHRSDKPVHEGGALVHPGDHDHDLVEKTHTHYLENAQPGEREEVLRDIEEWNANTAQTPAEIHEARKRALKEQEETVEATKRLYDEQLGRESDPEHLARVNAERQERLLKAQIHEAKEAAKNVDGRTVTEIAASVEKNVDEMGRPLDQARAYAEADRADAEARAAAERAAHEAEVKRLEAELHALKTPRSAAAPAEVRVDEMGRPLGESAESILAREEQERIQAEEVAIEQRRIEIEAEMERLEAEKPKKHRRHHVAKDEQGRPKDGPDMAHPEVKPTAKPATDQHEARPAKLDR